MQHQHLAIVRAALTFWDEEMASVSDTIYRHYLHSKDQGVEITPGNVALVRTYFNQVVPKFCLLDLQSGELASKQLVEDSRVLTCEPSQQIVSVLISR